ncbi:MAG: hypothetical protein P8179_24745 [Candidatus Thiodiazotropha sp.]
MIFEKNLEQDLRNIEFYTNIPCLIYIESGTEVLTNSSHGIISLHTGDCIFLPQGHNLHSDFVRETKSLKATLVFFADTLVAGYIKNLKSIAKCRSVARGYCVIEKSCAIKTFFESIDYRIQEDAYLNTKLLELLHLIAHTDKSSTFHPLLSETKILPPLATWHICQEEASLPSIATLKPFTTKVPSHGCCAKDCHGLVNFSNQITTRLPM